MTKQIDIGWAGRLVLRLLQNDRKWAEAIIKQAFPDMRLSKFRKDKGSKKSMMVNEPPEYPIPDPFERGE